MRANLRGCATLFGKETRRFLRMPAQTIAQPAIATALFVIVFGFALAPKIGSVDGASYARFVTPGLVALAVINNSFLNSAWSLFVVKLDGTITDILVAPLSPLEILAAYAGAAALRGLIVGVIVWLVAGAFGGFAVAAPLVFVVIALLAAIAFACYGLAVAIWSRRFEDLNLLSSFVITPLTFFGGVFYAVGRLPSPFRELTRLDPIFYLVEGVRFGIVGRAEASPRLALAVTALVAAIGIASAWWMLATSKKLRR